MQKPGYRIAWIHRTRILSTYLYNTWVNLVVSFSHRNQHGHSSRSSASASLLPANRSIKFWKPPNTKSFLEAPHCKRAWYSVCCRALRDREQMIHLVPLQEMEGGINTNAKQSSAWEMIYETKKRLERVAGSRQLNGNSQERSVVYSSSFRTGL